MTTLTFGLATAGCIYDEVHLTDKKQRSCCSIQHTLDLRARAMHGTPPSSQKVARIVSQVYKVRYLVTRFNIFGASNSCLFVAIRDIYNAEKQEDVDKIMEKSVETPIYAEFKEGVKRVDESNHLARIQGIAIALLLECTGQSPFKPSVVNSDIFLTSKSRDEWAQQNLYGQVAR